MPIPCACREFPPSPPLIVVTGGPGAGKTALLEVARRMFCDHVVILPEAASILFGGGFPRRRTGAAREAAQRAIFRVQSELERLTREERQASAVLCDRGTLDCLAYWDADPARFWAELGTTREHELARYTAVLHLRTPADGLGYDRSNPLRIEDAQQAAYRDRRILDVWAPHPARTIVDSAVSFFDKLAAAVAALRPLVPATCVLAPE
jgi:predicted ATPase